MHTPGSALGTALQSPFEDDSSSSLFALNDLSPISVILRYDLEHLPPFCCIQPFKMTYPDTTTGKYHVAIIGSGPIGKLLVSSVTPHPRIIYTQFEAESLPLRPSFGYGVGLQTLLHSARVLNPTLGRQLRERCIIGPVWMKFYHGGPEDCLIESVKVPNGKVYGRLGRQELLHLLDSFAPVGQRRSMASGSRSLRR